MYCINSYSFRKAIEKRDKTKHLQCHNVTYTQLDQMQMDYLLFTTVTDSGICYEIEFPLHRDTNSADAVSFLTSKLLSTISTCVNEIEDLKDGDILQALSMACAIRTRMINVDPNLAEQVLIDLIKQNHAAVMDAKQDITSRA